MVKPFNSKLDSCRITCMAMLESEDFGQVGEGNFWSVKKRRSEVGIKVQMKCVFSPCVANVYN